MTTPTFALTITYNNFSDLSAFTLNGSTAAIHSSGPVNFNGQDVLRLTDTIGQSGSAFLTDPLQLNNEMSFSTFFSFQITQPGGAFDPDGQGADGLTFTVQAMSNTALGGGGGGIGYQFLPNSMAVEFDTWLNQGFDNDGNHVGINFNGSINSVARAPVAPRLNDGNVWYSWIDYNGLNDLLEVRLAQQNVRPTNALLAYTVDLETILGSPPHVYVGFTSGTGGGWGDHDIRSWTFKDDAHIPGQTEIPEPATLLLLGSGLIALTGLKRKK